MCNNSQRKQFHRGECHERYRVPFAHRSHCRVRVLVFLPAVQPEQSAAQPVLPDGFRSAFSFWPTSYLPWIGHSVITVCPYGCQPDPIGDFHGRR